MSQDTLLTAVNWTIVVTVDRHFGKFLKSFLLDNNIRKDIRIDGVTTTWNSTLNSCGSHAWLDDGVIQTVLSMAREILPG